MLIFKMATTSVTPTSLIKFPDKDNVVNVVRTFKAAKISETLASQIWSSDTYNVVHVMLLFTAAVNSLTPGYAASCCRHLLASRLITCQMLSYLGLHSETRHVEFKLLVGDCKNIQMHFTAIVLFYAYAWHNACLEGYLVERIHATSGNVYGVRWLDVDSVRFALVQAANEDIVGPLHKEISTSQRSNVNPVMDEHGVPTKTADIAMVFAKFPDIAVHH